MKIAFLLYPTAKVKTEEDSSFWIMRELVRRGHTVSYCESRELIDTPDGPVAYLHPARLNVKKGYLPSPAGRAPEPLSEFGCIFIRKEPPFTTEYLYALQTLDRIKERVFVLNDPAGIAMANEKAFTLRFPGLTPASMVTSDPDEARRFIKKLKGRAVVKPLHEKGGAGILSTDGKDRNLPSILETMTKNGRRRVIAQAYAPVEKFGDKRILILDGKILGAFLRRPPRTDFRANLSVGGSMHAAKVTAADERLVGEMTPVLSRLGLHFVGIDVIGPWLTEVNVTSPAGIPEIHGYKKNFPEKAVCDFIERRA